MSTVMTPIAAHFTGPRHGDVITSTLSPTGTISIAPDIGPSKTQYLAAATAAKKIDTPDPLYDPSLAGLSRKARRRVL
jgi:hypothetical protein